MTAVTQGLAASARRRGGAVPTPGGRSELFHPMGVATLGGVLVAWQAAASLGLLSEVVLPAPTALVPAAREMLASGELQRHLAVSLLRVLAGFGLGAGIGVLLGVAMGRSRGVRDVVEPVANLLRQIPPIAWIPLALIWFGFGEGAKVYIIFLATVFPVLLNSCDGVQGVDPQLLRAASSLGASGSRLFIKVALPAALPQIFTGMTNGLGNAFRAVVAAELAGAFSGLGYMMMSAREVFRTDMVVVGMVTLGVLGLLLMGCMLAARRALLRWHLGEASA